MKPWILHSALLMSLCGGLSSRARAEAIANSEVSQPGQVQRVEEIAGSSDRILSTSFNLGQARFSGAGSRDGSEGQGLAFGFRLDFWKTIGLGMETQMLQLTPPSDSWRSAGGQTVILPYLSANLIHLDLEKWAFNGALTSGYIGGRGVVAGFHAGASFDLIYLQKVGIRYDLRAGGPVVGSLNTLSLTGYY